MPVKIRDLGEEICYLFNGSNFVVNRNLPAAQLKHAVVRCAKNLSWKDKDRETVPAGRCPGSAAGRDSEPVCPAGEENK